MRQGLSVFKRILSGVAILSLVFAGVSASAAQTASVSIPMSQIFKNNSSESVDATFTYRITPDKDNPVLEGMTDDTVSIEGNKEISLEIVFDRVGVYKYEIKQESANKPGYTYDSSIYTAMVYVRYDGDDGLKTDVFIQNPDGEKLEKIEFNNFYQKQEATTGEPTEPQPPASSEESTTESITTENITTKEEITDDDDDTEDDTEDEEDTEEDTEDDKPKGNGTKTGDRVIWPYYLLLICGTTLLCVCIRIKKLQK